MRNITKCENPASHINVIVNTDHRFDDIIGMHNWDFAICDIKVFELGTSALTEVPSSNTIDIANCEKRRVTLSVGESKQSVVPSLFAELSPKLF